MHHLNILYKDFASVLLIQERVTKETFEQNDSQRIDGI
jgi:hypothetical protein